jgi:hypothetical protein
MNRRDYAVLTHKKTFGEHGNRGGQLTTDKTHKTGKSNPHEAELVVFAATFSVMRCAGG